MNQGRYSIKRSDLPTSLILVAVAVHGSRAYDALDEAGWPDKVIIRAFERDVRLGYLDWGVSVARPFLTREGEAALKGSPQPG